MAGMAVMTLMVVPPHSAPPVVMVFDAVMEACTCPVFLPSASASKPYSHGKVAEAMKLVPACAVSLVMLVAVMVWPLPQLNSTREGAVVTPEMRALGVNLFLLASPTVTVAEGGRPSGVKMHTASSGRGVGAAGCCASVMVCERKAPKSPVISRNAEWLVVCVAGE